IAFDVVTGIALAAGGFTTAALVYVFNKGEYSPLVRPALLTALLGYGIAGFSIILDVGRWWQIYNPIWSWQGSSPLFEVSICVMSYLTVLFLEFVPIMAEKFDQNPDSLLAKIIVKIAPVVNRFLIALIILGIVISTLHQSSLGSVMMIAVARIHPLWHSAWMPLLFLISAIAIGFPVLVIESYYSAKAFGRKFEQGILSQLLKLTPWILGLYVVVRFADIIVTGELNLLVADIWGIVFVVEMCLIAIIPTVLLLNKKYRESDSGILTISWMMILGLVMNRFNTYLITYQPRPGWDYFPSLGEIIVSAMLVSLLFVGYKLLANYFPVLSKE
ncbi:MAG: Ni/Fe-hydrogenase cytochrome b subunit, partial [Melioribacteraceae bacterium]|nr:Ni/Fe-hydrogenase cytochrome b subunit [Melioribacteraceae bacterium]